ncbi:FGGY family carbohydrate kinase [Sphingomonas sp. BT-65]|uniref:FGGY family carbohydrate kinase n=1 Tax=Sphingomonas sp. BT-65 TaxID=2989821 RepID=UPI002236434B|nr:FGGY family carbohydrate kinase [Sphingomonas sp. BT-65]MCW4463493.1 FGGY family carbohydrate kinase [Sphingomonas sp. BT-65]
MPSSAILAIDQGTTNTKALLVAQDGTILSRAARPMTLAHPRPGWVEQPADDIWTSVAGAIADLVAENPHIAVEALAISNQRETIVLWDAATGIPLAPAISWQCRRSADRCAALRAAGHEPLLVERTGLGIDPLFSAAKLGWLLDSVPGGRARAEAGELRAGTVDSWLLWKLTAGESHATDHSNASRTQLFNRHSLDWDAGLAELFRIPLALLPAVRASDSLFGTAAAGVTALPAGVPIHAIMGDSHAALFGHGIDAPGTAKVTVGTGSSIMMLTDAPISSANGLSGTIGWSREVGGVRHALEGNITVSGQAAAFGMRLLGLADETALSALAQSVPNSGGVVFVPALAGLGAPYWQPDARGLLTGLTLATTPAHIARAVFEAIAMQIVDVCHAMEADLGAVMPGISADGGATRNDFLLQLLADLLDRPVTRCSSPELSALGAARMAAGMPARVPAAALDDAVTFVPAMDAARREAVHADWHAAVRRTLAQV